MNSDSKADSRFELSSKEKISTKKQKGVFGELINCVYRSDVTSNNK